MGGGHRPTTSTHAEFSRLYARRLSADIRRCVPCWLSIWLSNHAMVLCSPICARLAFFPVLAHPCVCLCSYHAVGVGELCTNVPDFKPIWTNICAGAIP